MARPVDPRRQPVPTTSTNLPDLRQFQDELQATLAARRELSPEMEGALVNSFLQQIERTIDARVDARVEEVSKRYLKKSGARTGTVAASLALSIPLLAIAGGIAGTTGIARVRVMVLIVNLIDFAKP
jgi:hypothetical protein